MQGYLFIEKERQKLEVWFQINSRPDWSTCRYCHSIGQRTVVVELTRIEDTFFDWSKYWQEVEERLRAILLYGSGFCTIVGREYCEEQLVQELFGIVSDHRGIINTWDIVDN